MNKILHAIVLAFLFFTQNANAQFGSDGSQYGGDGDPSGCGSTPNPDLSTVINFSSYNTASDGLGFSTQFIDEFNQFRGGFLVYAYEETGVGCYFRGWNLQVSPAGGGNTFTCSGDTFIQHWGELWNTDDFCAGTTVKTAMAIYMDNEDTHAAGFGDIYNDIIGYFGTSGVATGGALGANNDGQTSDFFNANLSNTSGGTPATNPGIVGTLAALNLTGDAPITWSLALTAATPNPVDCPGTPLQYSYNAQAFCTAGANAVNSTPGDILPLTAKLVIEDGCAGSILTVGGISATDTTANASGSCIDTGGSSTLANTVSVSCCGATTIKATLSAPDSFDPATAASFGSGTHLSNAILPTIRQELVLMRNCGDASTTILPNQICDFQLPYTADMNPVQTGGTYSGTLIAAGASVTADVLTIPTTVPIGTYTIVYTQGPAGCQDINTQNLEIIACKQCPELDSIVVNTRICEGSAVTVMGYMEARTPALIQNLDYYIRILDNGTEVFDGRGSDNLLGNVDDQIAPVSGSTITFTHTPNYAGTCDSLEHEYEIILYCAIPAPSLQFSSQSYGYDGDDNIAANTQGACYASPRLRCFPLDLSGVPACATTLNVTYAGSGSTSCCSPSWPSEMHMALLTPAGVCDDQDGGVDLGLPSTAGPWTFPTTVNTNLAGTSAQGTWQVCFLDDYDDGGTGAGTDGTIANLFLEVKYELAPGCPGLDNDSNGIADTVQLAASTYVYDLLEADDFTLPATACDTTFMACPNAELKFANAAAGPYTFDYIEQTADFTDGSIDDGDAIYYQIGYPASLTGLSTCAYTGSYTISQPAAPTPIGNNSICEGATSVPTAQQLTATCADCPGASCTDPCTADVACLGPDETIAVNVGSGNADYEGVGLNACGLGSQTTTGTFNVNVALPPIPACATNIGYSLDYTINIYGSSYFGEVGININGPLGALGPFQPSPDCDSGVMSGTFASGSGDPTGVWTFNISDGYSDSGVDGNLAVVFNVTYDMPTIVPVPPTPADITWYDAATGGTLQGTDSPFDPFGKIAEEGPVDLNTPGNYTFYAQCGCGDCVGTRTPVIFTVVPKADGPSVDDVELCIGGTVPTITPIGSVIGSVFNIYALGGTTPLNAAPQTQFTSANLVAYGFNPAVATSTTYLVTEIVTTGTLSCESAPTPFTITVNPAPVPTASNSGPYCEGETIEVSATGGAFYAWSGPGGYSAAGSPGFRFDADPTMAGTYTVTVTNLQTCTATANTDVVIKTTPIAPGATGSDMCIGETVPALSAVAPTCPGIAGTSSVPGATGTTTATLAATTPIPSAAPGSIPLTFTTPLPAGAIITGISIASGSFDWTAVSDGTSNTLGGNDLSIAANGANVYTEAPGCPGAFETGGTLPVIPISLTTLPLTDACGNIISGQTTLPTLTLLDCFDDETGGGFGGDGIPDGDLTALVVNVNYIMPATGTCMPAIPGGTANLTWWNSPVGGTQVGSGTTFTPISGTTSALQGIFSNTTPGTYTFFVESECASCTSVRTPVSITVNAPPLALAFNDGPICLGGTATLTAARGTTYAWDNGAGTGSPVSVSPATTTTYTVTVTDGNGCTATAATTVVVNPNPTAAIAAATYIVCEGGSVVIDGSATSGTAPYTYVWGGTGAPYLVNANLSDPIFDAQLAALGTYTLTLQIIDANGCSSTLATSSVDVVGGSTPVISCPSDITISAQTGLCNAFLVAPAPTYNNSCYGDLNLTYTLTGVTIGSGSDIPATTFNLGTTTVTYTVTDANVSTATASCSFTVTIEDNEPPIISCPADITVSAASNACTALVTVPLPPVVTDNCTAAPVVTYALSGATTSTGTGAATGTYNAGITIVTYTATDAAGNSAVCEMTVTVVENILPTITCPANLVRTVVADATTNCTYTATTAEVSPVIGDNCTAVTVAANVSYTAFGATSAIGTGAATLDYNVGTTFVTYTVTDASGNTRQCSFNVVVTDTTVPTITCPANVIGTTDLNTCNSLETIALPSNVADNCAVASYTNSYNNTPNASGVYPLGTTNVTYTVTDIYNNTATCAFSVTISDAQAPSIICPTSLTAYTGAGATTCSAVMTTLNTALSFDNCTAVPTLSYVLTGATTGSGTGGNANGTYNVGTTTVTFTATDNASNTATCAITVLVIDNTPPAIVCAADIAVSNLAGSCYATPNVPRPTALDNCTAAASLVHNYVLSGATTGSGSAIGAAGITGVNFNVGVTTVTWTVLDAVGNSSTCSLTVTVSDTEAPALTCPAAVTVNAASCSAFANVAALSVADNCGVGYSASFVITNTNNLGNNNTIVRSGLGVDASGIFPVGVSTVTYTVSDAAGNTASCSSTVTVNDVVAPTIVCPSSGDIMVYSNNNGTGDCDAAVAIEPIVSYDNCNSVVFTYTIQHFSTSNPATVVATVTGGNVGDFATGGSNWTSAPDASGDFSVGLNVITYTATDRYGNTSTCMLRVTVLDNEAPTITCPAPVTVNNTLGVCGNTNVTVAPLVSADNCGIATITNSHNAGGANASGSYPVGITTVTFTVTDINGNTSTCSSIVRVNDTEAPVAVCRPLVLNVNNSDPISISAAQVFGAASSDNCGTVNATSVTPNVFSCPNNNGVNTVTLTVTDAHGNTATCSTTVTINCCNAEAGTVAVGQVCPNTDIPLSAAGFSTTTGSNTYVHYYLIVNPATNVIVTNGVITAGATASVPYANLTPNTNYLVYGYVVKTNTTPAPTAPTVGFDVDNIASLAACWDITSPGVALYVPAVVPAIAAASITQGSTGGTSPFYYNIQTLTLSGGTQPYDFTWNNTGYVRYDIQYTTVNGIPGAIITVYYSDNANFGVTVTDNNECSTSTVSFNNIPTEPNALLDIDNFVVTPQTSNATPNGAITITPTDGSCNGAYTYQWSGPGGYTATTQNISGLAYGWYAVTVTCGTQTTEGWYWVPRARRGRNKVEGDVNAITIMPNPFAIETNISFSVSQSGMTKVAVYAPDGKEVARLFDEQADAEEVYEVQFNAGNLPSGVYLVRMESENGEVQTAKLMLTK